MRRRRRWPRSRNSRVQNSRNNALDWADNGWFFASTPRVIKLFCRQLAARLCLAIVLLLCRWSTASAQSTSPTPNSPYWGVAAGPSLAVPRWESRSDERAVLIAPSVSFSQASWLDFVVEGHLAQYFSPTGYVIGVTPGWRLYFGSRRCRPFVAGGVGVSATDLNQLHEIDRRFNFLSQASVGLQVGTAGGRAFTLETRFYHMSNGSTKPPNIGLNGLAVLAGWRSR
jgi:hypothetical protein